MQLLPGLYQVNGTPYGAPHNSFLVKRDNTTILIDSGDFGRSDYLPRVRSNARRWGIDIDDASHCLVTHEHFDHASHAAPLQRQGLRIVASGPSADAMREADMRCIGWVHDRVVEPCEVDQVVTDGEVLTSGDLRIRCLAAPGHCEGAMVYEIVLDGEVCWFTGDQFARSEEVGNADSVALGWNGAIDFDRARSIESLMRLAQLQCDHVFVGHGPPVLGYGKRVVARALERAMMDWR
jgi:glyoxylase-like metal-dependent hydrolase (beta-lactamase superfamily II)